VSATDKLADTPPSGASPLPHKADLITKPVPLVDKYPYNRALLAA
jgi:hypothetical protein